MIKEEGKVIDYKDGMVKILIDSKPACHSCNLCIRDKNGMMIDVKVDEAFFSGDLVYLEIEGRNLLLCFFMLYIFPVISFVMGIITGMIIAKILSYKRFQEPFGIISGFLFFIMSFYFVNRFDKKYKEKEKIIVKLKT